MIPALWMWGFTVDDALIPVRYARHLVLGLGWRFDAHGPSTDGVTPLPWPLVLAPLARGDALVVLGRAKALGLVVWVGACVALGREVGGVTKAPAWARASALTALALSVPVAAYAVSGMETALATALATFAALALRRPLAAAGLAGLAATLRPEMAPWACVLAAGAAIAGREKIGRVVAAAGVALAPFVACAVVRAVVWGRPAPLALMAKPSDLDQGIAYAGAACVVTLVPLLVLAPLALRRAPAALVVVLAAAVHVGAVVAVGGDWMPYARLMVPVVPSLVWAAALASAHAHPAATAARSLAALALGVYLVVRGGTDGRGVGADRAALVAEARPLLADTTRVAALDIGWVGAATDADIVDLAGLTDPEIAALPGGHTSKRVDAMFLLGRHPDALLLYLPGGLPGGLETWPDATYGHVVEARLAADEVVARHFFAAAWLPLGARGAGYVLLRALP
ncbi:MAG TPA: hypothetical protein VIF15_05290 [Polyangiaceae bacterium]